MDESVEQIDPTAEIPTDIVKKRAASGAAILTIRTIFLQAFSFFAILHPLCKLIITVLP